jgi:transposase InsO family protein
MGMYVGSESSFYRILQAEKLAAHRGKARAAGEVRVADEHVATEPNQVWSWDITYLKSPVKGLYYFLYMAVDIWSRKIVGWAVHEKECSELATALILEAWLREGVVDSKPLVLHSDNGGPMKGATLLATLQNLGSVPSFSRPQVSDDNPYSEALFRTLKYRPEYPSGVFTSLEAAQQWVACFVGWYNYEHRHSAIRFVTPAQRHSGEEHRILHHRKQVYEEARCKNPNRWSRRIRNWNPIAEVILNPSEQKSAVAEVELTRSA